MDLILILDVSKKRNMKKLKIILPFILMLVVAGVQAQKQKQYLEENQAPKEILQYVKTHFPSEKIVSIKEEKKISKTEYEVKLFDMTELEFDGNYQIKEIDSKKALPNSVIPASIRTYVTKNYPSSQIMEWKRKSKGQKVELDNDLELYFDHNGAFLRADD